MNGFDLSTVTNIYLGSTPVKKVYMGTKLIWSTGAFDYSAEYFTIESLEDNNQIGIVESGRPSISISTDKQAWTTVTPDTTPTYFITLNAGEKVYIKGSNNAYHDSSWSTEGYFTSTSKFNVYGNIMSLLYADNFQNQTTLESSSVFRKLFANANKLVSAEHLVLPATTLTYRCYNEMFTGCTSLTTAPELPATTLADSCYNGMFTDCTSLTTAPELPATTLTNNCYFYMLSGCSSLTTAPELPATTLAEYCYEGIFENCTSLTTAPELPATTLTKGCYGYMFKGCSSLTTAPELPATTLADNCYELMFLFCSSLTTAPTILPATTLAYSCYTNMFANCTSLTTAPELPATTLIFNCYMSMFYNCSSLNYIKMLATDVSASGCMDYWVTDVAPSGTFVKDASTTLPTGSSGIPDGWTVENVYDYATEYFTIESLEDNNQIGIVDSDRPSISISKDKQTWTTVTPNAAPTYFITLNAGEKVYIKGSNNAYYDSSWSTQGYFTSTGKFNVSGNIMSLLYEDDFKNKTTLSSSNSSAFMQLFYNANKLISAEHLVLPATTLADSCYSSMFQGCTSLTTAPELPATNLIQSCYSSMFSDCTSLTTAPELPATTLAGSCYLFMFQGCTSLTTAPELPATTLAGSCYLFMFQGCTSLTTAPELRAFTLVSSCYRGMFRHCTSLTSIGGSPFAFYKTAPYCCESMFSYCSSLKQTIVLIPETLTRNCYANMFNGCTKLESISCLAKDISAKNCTNNWLNNVASYGVFSRDTNMHDWPTGPSGIPKGWTVVTV